MSIEQKQGYLRREILDKDLNPADFYEYWQQCGICLEDVAFATLKGIVDKYVETKTKEDQDEFNEYQVAGYEAGKQAVLGGISANVHIDFNWDFLNQKYEKRQSPINQNRSYCKNKVDKIEKGMQQLCDQKQSNRSKRTQLQSNIYNLNPLDKSLTIRQVINGSKIATINCLKLQQSLLSHHINLQINIIKAEVADKTNSLIQKLWKDNCLLFTVKTIGRSKSKSVGLSWEVKRRYEDFEWLRNALIKFYPGLVVPPLPSRSKSKLVGCEKKLESFLMDVFRCPELKNSKYFEVGIRLLSQSDFEGFVKSSDGIAKPKTFGHILNMSGYIELLNGEKISEYGQGLQKYLTKSSQHLKRVKLILAQINEAYQKIGNLYLQLGDVFNQVSAQSHAFSDQICFSKLAKMYQQIAQLSHEHTNFCLSERSFIETYLQSHFAYEKDRFDNMQHMITKRNMFHSELAKRQQGEQATGLGVFSKLASIFGDKNESIDVPSTNLEILTNQVGYYNNQLLKESVRCIQTMIESHIVHFSSYGHSRVDNVDRMQKIWSNLLVQLSKLNLVK